MLRRGEDDLTCLSKYACIALFLLLPFFCFLSQLLPVFCPLSRRRGKEKKGRKILIHTPVGRIWKIVLQPQEVSGKMLKRNFPIGRACDHRNVYLIISHWRFTFFRWQIEEKEIEEEKLQQKSNILSSFSLQMGRRPHFSDLLLKEKRIGGTDWVFP